MDNYTQHTVLSVRSRNIPVLSMEEMGDEIRNSLLLITSIKFANEIIRQLDGISICDGLTFYIPELFTAVDNYVDFELEKPARIPKCIHYCWFGKGKMPERFCKNIETWKRYCQGYEFIKWDESNYDISKNLYMRQAYEVGKWGFVSDYARLDIINNYGGIYLDTDVEVLKPLDKLLQFDMFCGFETPRYINFGLGFGAGKGNKIIEDMIDEYDRLKFLLPNGRQNLVTCPIYQTRIMEKFGLEKNGKTQIKRDFTVLSSEYLNPVNGYGFGMPTERSFSIHQYAATWYDENQVKIKAKIIKNYEKILTRMDLC